MRLRQLDLTRYGKFTDFSIDFGERPTDGPDFHIIYGPNEAGKSTTFAAILDYLYGIDKRTRYAFKHPYNAMQLDGAVELNGAVERFTRLKRDQNSLLDRHGAPIPDSTILAELGGVDRLAFQTMFSLDDETLEQGGESILASRGELGELLFSASSGLASLSQSLASLRADSEKFFKPRGHTHELAQYKRDLDALKVRRDGLDVAASSYARLIEARSTASERYELARGALAVKKARLERLQRQTRAYPKYLAMRSTLQELELLPEVPEAPSHWEAEARELEGLLIRLETEERANASAISSVATELSGIEIDERLVQVAATFEDLEGLRARFVTSVKDLPARRSRKAEVDGAIASVLQRLERAEDDDANALILKPSVRGRLDDLIAERVQIDEIQRQANVELERAKREYDESQSAEGIASEERTPLSGAARHRLVSAIEALRASDHAARIRLGDKETQEKGEQLATQLQALRPWDGQIDALSHMPEPAAEDLEGWQAQFDELTTRRRLIDAEIETLEETQRTATAELSVLERIGGLVTDGDAQTLRRERETAWQAHQASLSHESADTFEIAMRRDDEVGAARLMNVSELARVNALSRQKALADLQLADKRKRSDELDERFTELKSTVSMAIAALSADLPVDWSVQRLTSWLGDRRAALAIVASLRKTAERINTAESDGAKLTTTLKAAMAQASTLEGLDLPHDQLLSKAEDIIETDTRLRAREAELSRLKRDLQARQATVASSNATLDKWRIEWRDACNACWLGIGQDEPPTPSTVRRIFAELEPLASELRIQADLAYRISAMELDQRDYAKRVAELTVLAGWPPGLSAADEDKALAKAIADAKSKAIAVKNAEDRQTELKKDAARIANDRTSFDARLAVMANHFRVTSLSEVSDNLAQLKIRGDLRQRAQGFEESLLETLELASLTGAVASLESFDAEAARLEIEQTALVIKDDEARLADLFAEKCRTSDQVDAIDGDNAVAKLDEERRTLLLQIEHDALRWLKLKLGVAAAEQALRLYREQHRSSLLVRASEAFRVVSRGAYASLSTLPDKDGEVLVAIARDGSSKRTSDLSKGTRFQLYLSLRVAGYQDLVARRQPVPFLADDILETFDDFRSEETLKVFSQMANAGQVIYFTHHQHLCDIAREVCPSVRIYDLQLAA